MEPVRARDVLFTAEKPGWSGWGLFGIPDYEALPGFGRHDDLWVAAADGGGAWRLNDDPDTRSDIDQLDLDPERLGVHR